MSQANEPEPTEALGFEVTDANPGMILRGLVVLSLLVTITSIGVRVIEGRFARGRDGGTSHPLSELRTEPEGPLLQADNAIEYGAYQREIRRTIGEYAWIDTVDGIVRIPQERALELALERGFEVRETLPR